MKSAQNIIQISSYYPPHLGGQENAVHDLAHQLANAGHNIHVLTSSVGSDMEGLRQEEKVLVHRLAGFVFGHAPIMPAFPLALFQAAKTGAVAHLHIGQAFTPEIVWLISKLRRMPYIAQLHIDFEPSGPAGILLPLYKRFVLKRVLRAASAVITLNQQTERIVRDTYGYTGNIHILNNGIDEAYFKLKRPALTAKPPEILNLLFVGRLSKQKNLVTLLEALQQTKRVVHLDVIGEGEDRELIERIIISKLLTNVTLHGRQPREAVMQFYQTCHALIMPSLYEAQPLVLLEALAARIPIIGTNVIGVAEHIKNAGIIVEPTVQGIVHGIEQYYELYDSLPSMVRRGYQAAQAMRWKSTLKKYEAVYESAAST